jgi:hypothetical protein
MGIWGYGNFDDDTSADYLESLMAQLVKDVNTAMANPREIEPDEYWGCAVPCSIEILNLLARQKWIGTIVPSVAVAEQWKREFLAVWDGSIDQLEPAPEYKKGRREALTKTFDELVKHALVHEKDPDEVVVRLQNPADAFEREVFTRALVGKAMTMSRGGRHEDAIAICDDVVARFGSAPELEVCDSVALALCWKAHSLAALGRLEAAISTYDAVVSRFGDAAEPRLARRAATACFDKAHRFKEAHRLEDAATAYREVISRFGAIEDAGVRHLVERSRQLLDDLK